MLINCRNLDNLQGWTKQMEGKTEDKFVLYLNCPLKVCEDRILERGKTSGRSDDNLGIRFISFIST